MNESRFEDESTDVGIYLRFQSLPVSLGVCLELAYPSSKIRKKHSFRNNIALNDFIDAILRTVYQTSALSEGRPSGSGPGSDSTHTHGFGYGYQGQSQSTGRRKVIFTSFSADACAAVNWKQPNCESFILSFLFGVERRACRACMLCSSI